MHGAAGGLTSVVQNEGCDEDELELLCDYFEHCMREMACTKCRKDFYDLSDFETAVERELGNFKLKSKAYTAAFSDVFPCRPLPWRADFAGLQMERPFAE